tara:strand:+ start:7392 stop:8516 length:1125 start_codon:yes stop_codon:yes gene_type:complete
MFEHPAFLLALLLIPLLGWRMLRRGESQSIPFSSAIQGLNVSPTWRQRITWLPVAMSLTALTLMIIAMARPREGREQTLIHSEGIAIEMVVDRSSSMTAMDFRLDGTNVDRLTAIKNVAGRFVAGDQSQRYTVDDSTQTDSETGPLQGRVSDLVGLIAFARYADAMTPPTLDHGFLTAQLQTVQIVNRRQEDGTAIGDAISLAVEKLDSLDKRTDEKVKSKVIILLTDGENTAGDVDPVRAAELATTLGIKIYTIGVGTKGRAPVPGRSPFTGRPQMQWMEVNIDEPTLKKIAETSGGRYFRATDTNSLESIYREIDQLEKTKVETDTYVDYRELAVQAVTLAGIRMPPIVLVALCLLLASFVLSRTALRQLAT